MAVAAVGEVALVALAAYSAYQTEQAAKKKPEMPKAPDLPSAPQSPQLDVNAQAKISQKESETAAGTIFSPNPGEDGGRISNDPLTPRKSLLGS
jgi:uncharacterized membrane protein YebE (DUF533 family)